jgi:hypothetical protein
MVPAVSRMWSVDLPTGAEEGEIVSSHAPVLTRKTRSCLILATLLSPIEDPPEKQKT